MHEDWHPTDLPRGQCTSDVPPHPRSGVIVSDGRGHESPLCLIGVASDEAGEQPVPHGPLQDFLATSVVALTYLGGLM